MNDLEFKAKVIEKLTHLSPQDVRKVVTTRMCPMNLGIKSLCEFNEASDTDCENCWKKYLK